MRTKITVLVALFAMVFQATAFAAVPTGAKASQPPPPAQTLVNMLPASDAIAVVDVKRVFSDLLPKLLATKQSALADFMKTLDDFQAKSGLDVRKFDQVAIGVKLPPAASKADPEVVGIAHGDFNSGALLGLIKMGTNGKYRTEKVGDKTLYIFNMDDAAATVAKKPAGTTKAPAAKAPAAAAKKPEVVAVTALDTNTIAIGTVARVRETAAARTTVSPELVALLPIERSTILSFAGQMPAGTAGMLPTGNGELEKTISSIRFVSGWMDMTESGALMHLMARTLESDRAQNLLETLQGLQMMGKGFLSSSTKPEQQVLGRMVESARIERNNNDVTLDLQVPQGDIDLLIGMIK